MTALPYDYFMVMEDDVIFNEGWRKKLEQALKDVPNDFDFLFVGSACAEDKEPTNIKGDVWHFPKREGKADYYPQTGYCYIVAKKALPILIATQRDTADQVDVSLIYKAFPYLNIYAILPRLAEQNQTEIPK
jgi:GR25 family glycosyltransferase involved in LPS biosynthesis